MGYYIIAVGGTGNKILESAVYAAAADAFHLNDTQEHIQVLHMLSVDVDAACGNTTRAKQAADCYENVRQAMAAETAARRCFHTAVDLKQWNINLSRRASSIRQMSQNHPADRLLADTLFTGQESELEYGEGFRGHPDLGVLFFSNILSSLNTMRLEGQQDDFNDMLDEIDQDLQHGDQVHLLLCGSIFGGTGASGVPTIARFLQKRYENNRNSFIMGAVLLLPYYQVPEYKSENDEIVVDSVSFLDKARTALQYYGMENMVRDDEKDSAGILDALYLLGVSPDQYVQAKNYSTGSASQENDAHLLEWFAARCASHFMRENFRGEGSGNIDCYYYQLNQSRLSWESFDDESAFYRERYGALLKSALCYCTECHSTIRRWVLLKDKKCGRVNYCSAFFHNSGSLSAANRAKLGKAIDSLYRFFGFYVNWLYQLIDNLPEFLRQSTVNQESLPSNELVDVRILQKLKDYLHDSGIGIRKSTLEAAEAQLQQGFHLLVKTPVKDSRNWAFLMSALGGGSQAGESFGDFLETLLWAVLEEQ